jgi:hypothetical protein
MDAGLYLQARRANRTGLAWARIHLIDIITLVLGTALTLRFWTLFFGIADRRLLTVLAALSTGEIIKRLIVSRRRWQRPQLFCAERRADLLAAIALAAAPWPITVPVYAASPLWTVAAPLAQNDWFGPLAIAAVVVIAIRRLVSD